MSYRVRYTAPSGATGYWEGTFATRTGATHSAQSRADITGYTFVVEELPAASTAAVPDTSTTERLVALMRERHAKGLAKYGTTVDRTDLTPEEWAQHAIEEMLDGAAYLTRLKDTMGQPAKRPEEVATPGSTAAHHVEILRARVSELEALVEERGKAVTDAHAANYAMHRDLAFAIQACDALREAMRTGEWRAGHDRSMANSAVAGWDRWKGSLAKAPSVPVGASQAPREGGDGNRRRLEALERWLRSKEDVSIVWMENRCLALNETGLAVDWGWSLAALADKLAEREAKP